MIPCCFYVMSYNKLYINDCPEVFWRNIIEIENDNGVYANTWLLFAVDPVEFIGKKVLAVPRYC